MANTDWNATVLVPFKIREINFLRISPPPLDTAKQNKTSETFVRSLIEYLLLVGRQSSQKRFLYYPGSALGGAGPNWEQFRSAEVPSQLAPRSVELGAGPSWEQLVQLA